jgi:hypothetical protein
MTHEALKIARTFKNDDESRLERAREEERRNNQILMRDYNPTPQPVKNEKNQKTDNNNDYDPRWERFGGIKPFEVWKKGNPNELKKPRRDPNSVFTPQIKKNFNNQNQGFNRERAKNYNNGGRGYGGNVGKGGKNNNINNNKNDKNKQPDPKSGKSAFFLASLSRR